jgi:hypothetical protein
MQAWIQTLAGQTQEVALLAVLEAVLEALVALLAFRVVLRVVLLSVVLLVALRVVLVVVVLLVALLVLPVAAVASSPEIWRRYKPRHFMPLSFGPEVSAPVEAPRRMPRARCWAWMKNRSDGCTRPDRWEIPVDRSIV